MSDIATALESIIGQPFLIKTEPDVLDFTNPIAKANLIIIAQGKTLDFPLPNKSVDLIKLIGQLQFYFSKSKLLIGWNAKNLFSYIGYITGKSFPAVTIIDLKILESFLGESNSCPTLFKHVKDRLEAITKNKHWAQLKTIYKSIHIPLICKIIPEIEILGLAHTKKRKIVHPYYEVEGQVNGRMKCSSLYSNGFNPHILTEEDKQFLTTPCFDDKEFIYFDFKNMEVSVLQWLSKDKMLENILKRGNDVYESIWETLTNLECSPERRKICKSFFLPVVFGQGVASLSENVGIPLESSKKIVNRIYKVFSTAMTWISSKDINSVKIDVDHFGRHRRFEEEYYRTQLRNFHVQAPASIVCLDKLVKIYEGIKPFGKVCFHVHDGYCVIPNSGEENRVIKLGREILEKEEDLYPGLRLRVAVSRGKKLNKLEKI